MKNNFWTILLVAGLTAIITFFLTRNFYGKPTFKPTASNIAATRPAEFELSGHAYELDSAVNDIDSFQSLLDTIINHVGQNGLPKGAINGLVGYTIGANDLINALGVVNQDGNIGTTYPFVRVYLGFNHGEGKFKLFVVPVSSSDPADHCGKDVFFEQSQSEKTPPHFYINTNQANSKSFVLDLISPCPSTCDVASPLVVDIQNKVSCCGTCNPTAVGRNSPVKK